MEKIGEEIQQCYVKHVELANRVRNIDHTFEAKNAFAHFHNPSTCFVGVHLHNDRLQCADLDRDRAILHALLSHAFLARHRDVHARFGILPDGVVGADFGAGKSSCECQIFFVF